MAPGNPAMAAARGLVAEPAPRNAPVACPSTSDTAPIPPLGAVSDGGGPLGFGGLAGGAVSAVRGPAGCGASAGVAVLARGDALAGAGVVAGGAPPPAGRSCAAAPVWASGRCWLAGLVMALPFRAGKRSLRPTGGWHGTAADPSWAATDRRPG
jgi:hypothetical protein